MFKSLYSRKHRQPPSPKPSIESTTSFSSQEEQPQRKSDYTNAVLMETSLNWTEEEEKLVESFWMDKCSTPSLSNSCGDTTIVAPSTGYTSGASAEFISPHFDPDAVIVKMYSNSSMREITVDLARLEKEIEENHALLKSIVKRNVEQYLSAFSVLQEITLLKLKTDQMRTLESTLKRKIDYLFTDLKDEITTVTRRALAALTAQEQHEGSK